MKTHLTLLLATMILLAACSQQNWYQGAQSAQTAHCMKQPLAEYNDCNQSQEASYQEYEKTQEELQNQDNN